jgi:hypothetical protein
VSQLQQYDESVICPVHGGEHDAVPGTFVCHVEDLQAFGIVIAKVGDQVNVLWSKEPKLFPDIQVQPIQAKARKLKAKWTAVEEETKFYGDFSYLSKSPRTIFEGEETYMAHELAPGQIDELMRDGEVTCFQDGRVEVKRRSHQLPDDVDPATVSVRRSRW